MSSKLKLKVDITKNSIQFGSRYSSLSCPNSLAVKAALRELYPTASKVSVSTFRGVTSMFVLDEKGEIMYYLTGKNPEKLKQFIADFDSGFDNMKPLSYEMVFDYDEDTGKALD